MRIRSAVRLVVACMTTLSVAHASNERGGEGEGSPIIGRWNVNVSGPAGSYPSWLEVERSGHKTLVGRFVGQFGSARPISQVFFDGTTVRFSLPVQWERETGELKFEGSLANDRLSGSTVDADGHRLSWMAVRAPGLIRSRKPEWGAPIKLFDGASLSGWRPRTSGKATNWVARNGEMVSLRSGSDLMTEGKFTDFKLHIEFRYPKGSNSGVYLRGRYEAQIEDDFGVKPESHIMGGIYGFLQPRINAAKPAGEWQSYDLTLVGRTVTVILNGETVIDRQEIPGMTGGALDNDEAAPGPILLQGDHGPIDFRNIVLTPAR